MSWEQRNHDFSTAQVDAQVAYIEAEREVKRLEAENARLRELVRDMFYAVHPADREQFLINVAELGVEV